MRGAQSVATDRRDCAIDARYRLETLGREVAAVVTYIANSGGNAAYAVPASDRR